MGSAVESVVSTVSGLDPTGVTGSIYRNMQGRDAAKAQRGMMDAQLQNEERMRLEAANAAEASPYEIARLEDAYKASNNEFMRREKILASADPALIEAGNQALALMQGKEAATLSPLKNQRAKQRAQLENQLRQRLGSGYAESSAGIQALSAFDEATDNTLAQAQQASLSQFLGVASNASANNQLLPVSQSFVSLAGARGNINARVANALSNNQIKSVGGGQLEDYLNATGNINSSAQMEARMDKKGDKIMELFGKAATGGAGG